MPQTGSLSKELYVILLMCITTKLSSASSAPPLSVELKKFVRKVSHYFLDFLETDFKRQQAPRRKVQLTSDTGFRTGVPLRKYPQLFQHLWKLAAEPATGNLKFTAGAAAS